MKAFFRFAAKRVEAMVRVLGTRPGLREAIATASGFRQSVTESQETLDNRTGGAKALTVRRQRNRHRKPRAAPTKAAGAKAAKCPTQLQWKVNGGDGVLVPLWATKGSTFALKYAELVDAQYNGGYEKHGGVSAAGGGPYVLRGYSCCYCHSTSYASPRKR